MLETVEINEIITKRVSRQYTISFKEQIHWHVWVKVEKINSMQFCFYDVLQERKIPQTLTKTAKKYRLSLHQKVFDEIHWNESSRRLFKNEKTKAKLSQKKRTENRKKTGNHSSNVTVRWKNQKTLKTAFLFQFFFLTPQYQKKTFFYRNVWWKN